MNDKVEAITIELTEDEVMETYNFGASIIVKIAQKHNIDTDLIIKNLPDIRFVDTDSFGEEIKKIDPTVEYTNDEIGRAVGKIIWKDEKCYIVINSMILAILIKTEYKDTNSIFTIAHEFGHFFNHFFNPHLKHNEKIKGSVPLIEVCKYTFSIMIDEYMANKYIEFLFTEEQCKEILKDNNLYDDLDNIYNDIKVEYDLFNNFWNRTNCILVNLFSKIAISLKAGGFKKSKVLDILNIEKLHRLLENKEPDYDFILNSLIESFNIIVDNYNANNPETKQKYIIK